MSAGKLAFLDSADAFGNDLHVVCDKFHRRREKKIILNRVNAQTNEIQLRTKTKVREALIK